VSTKLKVPLKDAMVFMVLDDFFDDLKTAGHNAWNTGKQFVLDNSDFFKNLVASFVKTAVPASAPLFDAAWTAFGG